MAIWQAEPPKRRGRPKKSNPKADAIAAEAAAAFPAADTGAIPTASNVSDDAKEKKKVIDAVKEIPEIFTAEQIEWVFDAYVGILCLVYCNILKTDFMALWEELKFDEETKKSLSKPLAKICSKHAPASWAANTAEIEIIMMLGVWTASSFKRARNVQQAQLEKKRDAERTQPMPPTRPQREVHLPT